MQSQHIKEKITDFNARVKFEVSFYSARKCFIEDNVYENYTSSRCPSVSTSPTIILSDAIDTNDVVEIPLMETLPSNQSDNAIQITANKPIQRNAAIKIETSASNKSDNVDPITGIESQEF